MKYKVLVLDMDGTLLSPQNEITPRTKSALIRTQENGIRLVLASGRPTYGMTAQANELQLDKHHGCILSYNGGQIIDWQTKEVLHKAELPSEVLPYLYMSAKTNGMSILSYRGDTIITENPEDKYVQEEATLVKMPVEKVDNFLAATTHPLPKCLIVGEASRLEILEQEMKAHLQGKIGVFRSAPFFLELVSPGIDKALSLAVLLDKLGISVDELVAVGDGFNDLTMIQYAGLGVAMANAQEVVKAAADYITLSNAEDGVAHVVEKFLLT